MDVTRPGPAPSSWQVRDGHRCRPLRRARPRHGGDLRRAGGGARRRRPRRSRSCWSTAGSPTGSPTGSRSFQPLALAGYRPIAVDMPGHGGSPLVGRFSFDRCATALADVIEANSPGRPAVLVGYSMGGPISQTVARDHPHQVAGLVQIATAAHIIPSSVGRGVMGGFAAGRRGRRGGRRHAQLRVAVPAGRALGRPVPGSRRPRGLDGAGHLEAGPARGGRRAGPLRLAVVGRRPRRGRRVGRHPRRPGGAGRRPAGAGGRCCGPGRSSSAGATWPACAPASASPPPRR